MIPHWLHLLSIAGLVLGFVCAGIVLLDVIRHKPSMAVMVVVWPVTALFGTVLTLALYRGYARGRADTPFWASVAKGASHCGAGCTLGDIGAEWLCFAVPSIAVLFGWGSLFGDEMYAVWIVDFVFAFVIGVAFQYWAIKPMGDMSAAEAGWAALKADTLSLTSWQVGMYGFMALAKLVLFGEVLGAALPVDSVEFWFMMQIAMVCGFVTAFPVNWWLIRSGVKEAM